MLKSIPMLLVTTVLSLVGGSFLPAVADDDAANPDTLLVIPVDTEVPETLSEVFNQVFFEETGNFYHAIEIGSQLNTILGFKSFPGSYPEIEVARDARLLNQLYRSALEQQVSSAPPLRTPNLDNPFDTSVRLNPDYLELALPD